ncbi:MAG: GNAT family N-acetyltransferase [Acidobacteria bacterium]|nr:GNAT family N-acetyltransferase [Acidobacteriota bacterium]
MEIRVRAATRDDGRLWLGLFESVAVDGWLGSELPLESTKFLDGIHEWVSDLDRAVQIAEVDGLAVGWISAHLDDGAVDLGMGILEGYRGRGVGTALMTAAIEWAEQAGASRLVLEVFPHNEAAIRLYRKFRFTEIERRVGAHRRRSGEVWDGIVMARPIKIDWDGWHRDYQDPDSKISRRL